LATTAELTKQLVHLFLGRYEQTPALPDSSNSKTPHRKAINKFQNKPQQQLMLVTNRHTVIQLSYAQNTDFSFGSENIVSLFLSSRKTEYSVKYSKIQHIQYNLEL